MGIPSKNDLVAHRGSLLPENGIRVMPMGAVAQKIVLQRNTAGPGLPAEAAHVGAVDGFIPYKTENIGMDEAGEGPCVQGLGALIHEMNQPRLIFARSGYVGPAFLVVQKMLTQDEILIGMGLQHTEQISEQGGEILHLKANVNVDFPAEFLFEGGNGVHVISGLLGLHPHSRTEIRVGLGYVIGKAKDLEAFLDGIFLNAQKTTVSASENEVKAFKLFMEKYKNGLAVENLAAEVL